MKLTFLVRVSLLVILFSASSQISGQRVSVGLFGGVSNQELTFEWISPVNVKAQTTPKWESFHYGATGRFRLYQGLSIRSDIYYMQSKTAFVAEYKILNTKWTADADFKQNTINVLFAPQINFGPRRFAYVFGGFMYEINNGSDFTKGIFTQVETNGQTDTQDFKNDPVNNTVSPAAVVGLGINPRFGRYGFMLDARYTRSRAEAVNSLVPRIGRENIAYTLGFTYDIME
jgi:Outer membrane protein beta-barrel domain